MKKIIILLAFLLVLSPVFAQKYAINGKSTNVELVFDQTITLAATSSDSTGTIATSAVYFYTIDTLKSNKINIECDSIAFVIELYSLDSASVGDSVALDVRWQPTSPNGYVDSCAFASMTVLIDRSKLGGKAKFGSVIALAQTKKLYGYLWIRIGQDYKSKQRIKLKIYAIKKWATT